VPNTTRPGTGNAFNKSIPQVEEEFLIVNPGDKEKRAKKD
jgi:hypothetical protein